MEKREEEDDEQRLLWGPAGPIYKKKKVKRHQEKRSDHGKFVATSVPRFSRPPRFGVVFEVIRYDDFEEQRPARMTSQQVRVGGNVKIGSRTSRRHEIHRRYRSKDEPPKEGKIY